jgi:hypothetical protein
MKVTRASIFFVLAALSTSAHAWWFFFIPGAVVSGIGDAITGAEGAHCVGETAKVGDRIQLPNGSSMIVKSLSGTSSRCANPALPIRAKLEAEEPTSPMPVARSFSPSSSSTTATMVGAETTVRLELSDRWVRQQMSVIQRNTGTVLIANNVDLKSTLVVETIRRRDLGDVFAYVNRRRDQRVDMLDRWLDTGVAALNINGAPAWQFEVHGIRRDSGDPASYMVTIIEGRDEVIEILAWTEAARFNQTQREALLLIVNSAAGLTPPVAQPAYSTPPPAASTQDQSQTPTPPAQVSAPPTLDDNSTARRLRELESLRKQGLVNEIEYAEKRKIILKDL